MTPDPEAVTVAALRAVLGNATAAGTRISTRLSGVYPAVRVALVGGPASPTVQTGMPVLQWEAWGADSSAAAEQQASELAKLLHDAAERLAGTYTDGRIVSSVQVGHYFHSPDPSTKRERYIGQLQIVTQP